jgi:hypothetical protein
LSSGVLDLIEHALKARADLHCVADLHHIDLDNPEGAAAALKTAGPAIGKQERDSLQDSVAAVTGGKDNLTLVLIELQDKSLELKRSSDRAKGGPKALKVEVKEGAPERDGLEHLYDAVIQVTKFVLELSDGVLGAVLELFGTDLAKDAVKGGDPDKLLSSLKASVEELQDAVREAAAEEAADTAKIFDALANAAITSYGHYVADVRRFNERFKAILAKLPTAPSGNPASPEVLGLTLVYHAVVEASRASAAAVAGISQSKEMGHLDYWESTLVPLGKLVFDGRDPTGELVEMMVSEKGGHQLVFNLPSQGLRNSLDEMAAAIPKIRGMNSDDAAAMERLADKWMSALADGI